MAVETPETPMTIHAVITFAVARPLTQDEGMELWKKADHLVRKASGVYMFSTSLDTQDMTGALDDVARWISDRVGTPIRVIGIEAAVTEEVPRGTA